MKVKKNSEIDFLNSRAKKAFIYLQKAFTEAPILRHFDLKRHIWIETDVSRYAIRRVFSQITSNQHFFGYVTYKDLISSKSKIGQWHPIAFFSQKMIPTETQYKTHNQELLPIIKAFKTLHHYLEGCKYKIFILIDHNNFRQFMDTKSLSSCQVCWA